MIMIVLIDMFAEALGLRTRTISFMAKNIATRRIVDVDGRTVRKSKAVEA